MILVLLGTQNNSFHRLLEEIEKNIENENIKDEVIVQAGFTKFETSKMKMFDLIPKEELVKLIQESNLIITHGGVGSIMLAIENGKKVIAVPRQKKFGEHVNDHQFEIIETYKKQGLIIGIEDVSQLPQALIDVQNFQVKKIQKETNNIIKLIDDFIQNDTNKKRRNK